MIRLKAVFLFLLALATPAGAATCEKLRFDETPFTVCTVDPAAEELRLFLRDKDGRVLGSFSRVKQALEAEGLTLGVAMNAGMYHSDRSPVGLYVEDGVQEMRLVTSAGPGNFGMLPNGVLCLNEGRADVIEARAFRDDGQTCRYATQSGPMLVIDGALHPRFLEDSSTQFIRNGVGVDAKGLVYLAISDAPVRFHLFGRLFRDHLKTPNALFLDGKVSKLYAPDLGRSGFGLPMGPILGTVQPLDEPAAAQ
ncbi:phosphodiester glycosidase family protein [Actibacterium pelagium]|uniref:Phosphodiester glycosidase domain-containing protein n=1 Tax=Actibacterium pelagium TaxID=2029103 RepID=A0A917AHN7_9RHOB|nr:phosphodiester glycosidase family protein [Actibacterium pelagium]GGE53518.1 hypothetical protein GCM10011517_21550 [Actibacterium pelagium]